MLALSVIAVGLLSSPHHQLSTRVVDGPSHPHAMQMKSAPPMRAEPQLPSSFTMPSDGNFRAPTLGRRSLANPSFVGSFSSHGFERHSAGELTTSGVPLKQNSQRQKSLDISTLPPTTITATTINPIGRTAQPRASGIRSTATYGPNWLRVDLSETGTAPPVARHPGLSKLSEP